MLSFLASRFIRQEVSLSPRASMFLPIVKFFTTEQGEVLEFVSRQLAFPEIVPNDSRLDP